MSQNASQKESGCEYFSVLICAGRICT